MFWSIKTAVIIDAIKRIDEEMSRVRQILPGMEYRHLPQQDKLNLLSAEREEVLFRLKAGKSRRFVQGIGTGVPRSYSGFGKGDCRICNPLS